jgi:DNA polymerase-3 subunit gamma/tau
MLTKEAFNALLKTLEEPPSHVIFIFATTEIFKVPATILSRCQHFDFRRISVGQIADSLKGIAEKEDITISDRGLYWIAQGGEGSLRDAQSIFDQVISYTGSEIKDVDIEELLGIREKKLIYDVSRAIIERKADICLKIVADAFYAGVDIRQFYQMLLNHMMNLLAVKITKNDTIREDLSDDETRELKEQADQVSRETIQRLLDILMAEEDDLKKSMDPRLNLEFVLVKMAYLEPIIPIDEILARMERLERRLLSNGAERPGGVTKSIQSEQLSISADRGISAGSERGSDADLWNDFKTLVKKKSYPLWSMLEEGTLEEYKNGNMRIGFPEGFVFLENIREASKIDQLTQIAGEFFRDNVSVDIKTLAGNKRAPSDSGKMIEDIKREALHNPLVQKVMDIFEDPEIIDVIVRNQDERLRR